jgi:hypothetical protein
VGVESIGTDSLEAGEAGVQLEPVVSQVGREQEDALSGAEPGQRRVHVPNFDPRGGGRERERES